MCALTGRQWKELFEQEHSDKAYEHALRIVREATNPASKKQLVLVIGNGGVSDLRFQRRNELLEWFRSHAASQGIPPPTTVQERELIWRYNEEIRHFSANYMPRPALVYLSHLILEGYCSLVITPSYDVFLQSILRKVGLFYLLNPTPSTHHLYHDGYGAMSTNSPNVTIWKYHGDVEHVIFEKCRDIFRLPQFPVMPFAPPEGLAGRTFKSSLPQPAPSPEGMLHYYTGNTHVTGWPDHYIDFNFPNTPRTDLFSNEITGTVDSIEKLKKTDTAGILIVGFAGRWRSGKDRMSEEIIPALVQKNSEGIPIIMIFKPSPRQTRYLFLAENLYREDPNQLWLGDTKELVGKLFDSVPELRPALSLDLAWSDEGFFAQ